MRVLIDEPAIARDIDEQHPPGATGQRGAHGNELVPPTLYRTEIARDGVGDRSGRPAATTAQAGEVDLMEQGRIERMSSSRFRPTTELHSAR